MPDDATISLFSGAGGMSLGFSQAGLKPVISADQNTDACATYEQNLGVRPFNIDLANPSSDFTQSIERIKNPIFLIGGPPCQGFSSAGLKNGDDERNKLIFSYLSIVEKVSPRWFLFENVEGLLTSNRGESIFLLAKSLISLGYKIRIEKVNFASYGLPQGRKRVVIIGNRMGVSFSFPKEFFSFDSGKHKQINSLPPAPSLIEAIGSLGASTPSLRDASTYRSINPENEYDAMMRNGSDGVFYQHSVSITKSQLPAISALKPGQTMKDLPEEYWHDSFKRRANRRVKDGTPTEKRGGSPSGIKRLNGNLSSLTITSASTREFIHPDFDRPLTYRECARLQSFPDHFTFTGNRQSIATQIGNAFPPLAAKILAKHISTIDGSYGSDISPNKGGLIDYELTKASAISPALARTNALLASICDKQSSFQLF